MRPSLEEYALALAEAASARSEDPYRRVGACLVRSDKTVISLGYNGAPPGVEIDWKDRDERRRWVVHAEANALRYARPGEVELLATTSLPCETCMLMIASYGVRRVYFRDLLDPAVYDNARSLRIAERSGIALTQVQQRADICKCPPAVHTVCVEHGHADDGACAPHLHVGGDGRGLTGIAGKGAA
jgi:dCMP deaminase